jgi:magnesium chelatase family protein
VIGSTLSACLDGVKAHTVEVQADLTAGLPTFTIVGLTDKAVQEARERVKSALLNSGLSFPTRRLIVNLAPAELHKEGTAFDLAIAVAVLRANGNEWDLGRSGFVGELGLDGALRPVRGALVLSTHLAGTGAQRLYVPCLNAPEAATAGVTVIPVETLAQLVDHLAGEAAIAPYRGGGPRPRPPTPRLDLAEIQGHAIGKRALEIAAAGGHHLLFSGPPGAGKSMLAQAFAGLLPDLAVDQSREVTAIHSVAGLLNGPGLLRRPPARAPHHSISIAGLLGGGTKTFHPGEVTLSHRGVLVLDELPEFHRNCLEALREPLEDGVVRLSRASGTRLLPATFVLIATANPCPCGHALAPKAGHCAPTAECSCPPDLIARYQRRVSGPFRDRIDLRVEVRPVQLVSLSRAPVGETSEVVGTRVEAARRFQRERRAQTGLNASLSPRQLPALCPLTTEAEQTVTSMSDHYGLTGRGFHGVLRVARTIADLAARECIETTDLLEACEYRAA